MQMLVDLGILVEAWKFSHGEHLRASCERLNLAPLKQLPCERSRMFVKGGRKANFQAQIGAHGAIFMAMEKTSIWRLLEARSCSQEELQIQRTWVIPSLINLGMFIKKEGMHDRSQLRAHGDVHLNLTKEVSRGSNDDRPIIAHEP